MSVLVIIPAYNEEGNLPIVFQDLSSNFSSADFLVINDGSTDGTREAAEAHGAELIDLPYNLGIGAAMQTGFMFAFKAGYDVAIQFDGDGQHRADEIENILRPVLDGSADMAVGSRFLGKSGYKVPVLRRAGIKIFSSILTFMTGIRFTDATSGFRAYGKRAIEMFSKYYPDDYPEVEAILLLHRNGIKVVEVPSEMRQRPSGKSSITFLRAVYYMVKVPLAVLTRRRNPADNIR
ncbi:MAG: glycosyltransferase family 2 protein [Thermodesulfovibrionales bacterium]|nr:glycosyltransferase family 2 protein [Thermodesulfovibrionales bacterium]